MKTTGTYRGRLAPTPTGLLHAGHAATFGLAWNRARAAGGKVLLRIEDLDPHRCREEFTEACQRDLTWLGLLWDEGPYFQSGRRNLYLAAWKQLRDAGAIYPCDRSRRDVSTAAHAPHGEEPLFPKSWRVDPKVGLAYESPAGINWRFRVPDGEPMAFADGRLGFIQRHSGVDFGDFLVWNRADIPAYELAVVVDDSDQQITEVVRGEDLVMSTFRQLSLYRALGREAPCFYHGPLLLDASGRRLAKRSDALSLAALRDRGLLPADVFQLIFR